MIHDPLYSTGALRKLPVLSTDPELNDRISRICSKFGNYFQPVFLGDPIEALEYLEFELPEINVIHFSDRQMDTDLVLEKIKADPWLHYGGIIGVHTRDDELEVTRKTPNSNVLCLISRGEFVGTFYRVLRILIQNRQIVFQRELQNALLGTISGSFVMDNDPSNIRTYANLVTNYLYNSSYLNREQKDRLHVALFELLMNAVEHGNCRITYSEKTQWLETHGDILQLIRRKCMLSEIRGRKVFFSYRITPERSYFTIRDQGDGFNWQQRKDTSNELNLGLHGHGIKMVGHYVENLGYNDRGNEVSFEFPHADHESNAVPGVFADQEELLCNNGEVVFTEGEESNHLYYIVSGKLEIYSGSNLVSTLSPDDIFLGEMSFLLNNRRSATVVSRGHSSLIRVSKNDFVDVIKRHPHYGLFLARLLAQRLSKLNSMVARLQSGEETADAQRRL